MREVYDTRISTFGGGSSRLFIAAQRVLSGLVIAERLEPRRLECNVALGHRESGERGDDQGDDRRRRPN